MDLFQNEHSLLNSFFRSTPCTMPLILIAIYIFTKNIFIYYLIIGWFIIGYGGGFFLKNIISKPIGNYLSNIYQSNNFPIIGRFKRPEGAANCDCFYVSPDNYSFTQGMPSGHSILSGFIAVFMYNFIIDNYNIKSKYKPFLLFLSMLFILYTMYSRVLMNCHTIQQTIFGAIIGSVCGYYYYIYILNRIKKDKQKK
jgi:membrane-associated phospholipid phosphatase